MPNTPLFVSKMCALDVSENVHMMFLKYVHTTFLNVAQDISEVCAVRSERPVAAG